MPMTLNARNFTMLQSGCVPRPNPVISNQLSCPLSKQRVCYDGPMSVIAETSARIDFSPRLSQLIW